MRKNRILLMSILIYVQGLLSACRLPEPQIPESNIEVIEEKEAIDYTKYDSNLYVVTDVSYTRLSLEGAKKLGQKGADLVYGDMIMYRPSLDEEENAPEYSDCYTFRSGDNYYQLVVTWEEGVEAEYSTPLTSAFFSLVSDPSVSVDLMVGHIDTVLKHELHLQGK